MNYLLNIDEAIDRKFLVTKAMRGQADIGTIIHVMDAEQQGQAVIVYYRVTRYNEKFHDYQDYTAKFENLAAFCKWAQPDNFIARNYECFSIRDIQHYIKVKNRSFASFCLPIILVAAIIIWVALALLMFKTNLIVGVIIGAVLTLLVIVLAFSLLKMQKKKEKMRLYRKVSAGWGVVFE
ncbi:hypothetical protein [Ruminococcus flavefaciens]|jgi:hypothetical protein|uniref:Uncharacterized protein n=1 Tax=Ruminococcus flavefaciens TaxID=1265 RepID=A0A1K1PYZ9_RUMFL|nr:hypothetical protein [Ruminococcus flavefaciens]SFW52086.1 hypothetical protein SAMN02910280_0221 [Ruminococcus flavefaciens]